MFALHANILKLIMSCGLRGIKMEIRTYLARKLFPSYESVVRLREFCGFGTLRLDTEVYLSEKGLITSGASIVTRGGGGKIRVPHTIVSGEGNKILRGLVARLAGLKI